MSETYNPKTLLDGGDHRLTLCANLKPASGLNRFQPAGFPEVGHVLYDDPKPEADRKICIVDSAASMANHLESVCLENTFSMALHPDLKGMPYVEVWTDDGRLVMNSLCEGHRLASGYFVDEKRAHLGSIEGEPFLSQLKTEFGLQDLGTNTHPLPNEWWKVFKTIFKYDPNSLVHGILFPALGIKLPRVLTAHLEAYGATRVSSSGVKFDKLGQTDSGQPIFNVDEETARELRATFVVDLSLIRSFGNGDNGLNDAQKEFLLGFCLWKIQRLTEAPFRYRTNCDLECETPPVSGLNIGDLIQKAGFTNDPVTKIFWKANEIFSQKGKDNGA